jgi:hybrid cluster-associated redox disulfide protein
MKFTKEMTIGEALKAHPRVYEVFMKYHMSCALCMLGSEESIEQGALLHGVEVEKILAELNQLAEEESKKAKNEQEE